MSRQLDGFSGEARELNDHESNVEYVARLWDAFSTEGIDKLCELIPDDVEWMPLEAGRTLHGTRELHEYWASREVTIPTARMYHGCGDDVLVQAELPLPGDTVKQLWLLYRFDGHRLVQAIGFDSEAEALSYGRLARGLPHTGVASSERHK